jgi:hypothetical protein
LVPNSAFAMQIGHRKFNLHVRRPVRAGDDRLARFLQYLITCFKSAGRLAESQSK